MGIQPESKKGLPEDYRRGYSERSGRHLVVASVSELGCITVDDGLQGMKGATEASFGTTRPEVRGSNFSINGL